MQQTKLHNLAQIGQSIWLDNISCSLIESGRLKELITEGLRGLTSNPSIFDKAISQSNDYDKKIIELKMQGKSVFEIYDLLSISDVQAACDAFLPFYNNSNGFDGFVSLEIDPRLADDAQKSLLEARRLANAVSRPNLMIKVPANDAGFTVIQGLLAEGVNVNATLIFSREQYERAAESFLQGMSKLSCDYPRLLNKTHSVASVFVSRVDTYIDQQLKILLEGEKEQDKRDKLNSLPGRAALANCHLIYLKHLEIFSSKSFNTLEQKGVNLQRIVWASTSTKNASYSDIKYVQELILANSVNTLPEETIAAFLDHGSAELVLLKEAKLAQEVISSLKACGIDVNEVYNILQHQGIAAFEKSFQSLLNSIETKSASLPR